MMEIIREFTKTKETNKVTGEQAVCWAKMVEAQKALLEANKENTAFDAVMKAFKAKPLHTKHKKKQRNTPKQLQILWHPT